MQLLLDTHAFLWWLDGNKQLPQTVRDLIANEKNSILFSAASAWEITTKVRIGKLPGAVEVANNIANCLLEQGFTELPITINHAQKAGALPSLHKDPFDRMLIAQALIENVPLISNEKLFNQYTIQRIW